MSTPHVQIGIPKLDRSGWSPWLAYQWAFMRSPKKILVLREGRGTGKTAQLVAKTTAIANSYDRLRTLWLLPDSDAFENAVLPKFLATDETYENLYGYPLIKHMRNSNGKQQITLHNDSLIVFKTAGNIQSVRGGEYGLIVADEGAKIDATADAYASFAPCLRGYGPRRMLLGGTPEGYSGLLGLALSWAKAGDPDVQLFTAASADNKYWDPKELTRLRATMSDRMWKQEMLGESDIGMDGLIYTTFDPAIHIRTEPFNARKLIREGQYKYYTCIDWGPKRGCALWLAVRKYKNTLQPEVVVFHQMDFECTPNFKMVEAAIAWNDANLDNRPDAMIVDYEGFDRDLFRRCDALNYADWIRREKPSILGTIELVQRALGSATDPVFLTLSREYAALPTNQEGPQGKGLIQGFATYHFPNRPGATGNRPYDDDKTQHALDLLRYFYANCNKIGYEWQDLQYCTPAYLDYYKDRSR